MANNAYFGQAPDESHDVSFERVFGAAGIIPEVDQFGGVSKEYWNPFDGVDLKDDIRKELIMKQSISTTTGGAGTAGNAMIPVFVDSNIVDRTKRETPLALLFARRAMRGVTYDYIPLTAKAGAQWNFEDAALADQLDTYTRVSIPVKYLYAVGRVTGPAIAGMRGFIDPTQLDLAVKTASIREAEEDMIINGDLTTNTEEPDGLIQLITTNSTSLAGAALAISDFRAELANSFNNNGLINLAVTDASTHNSFKALLMDFQRQVAMPTDGLPFGIPDSYSLDGVNIIKDRFMPTTAGSRRMLMLDTRWIFLPVLQDTTFEELAKDNDSRKYMLKEYLTFALTHEAACAQITSIA